MLAVAGQCADEYITAGIASARVYFAGGVHSTAWPRYGVETTGSDPYGAVLNAAGGYVMAIDGNIDSGSVTVKTAASASSSWPAGTWPAWVAVQVMLDRPYNDISQGAHL